MASKNPILISDLDESLISRINLPDDELRIEINMKLLDIFHRAMLLRKKNKIDAIMLLTNNTNRLVKRNGIEIRFLDVVNDTLVEIYNKKYAPEKISTMNDIFDIIYTAQPDVPRGIKNRTYNLVKQTSVPWAPEVVYEPGPSMTGLRWREVKNIATVKKMVGNINRSISQENLEQRIYFFDDEAIPHNIKDEIKGGSYITITPPFGKGPDETNFSSIYTLLEKLESTTGGYKIKNTKKIQKRLNGRTRRQNSKAGKTAK
jgi:hypothetical protein